jgi:hypothetical protein
MEVVQEALVRRRAEEALSLVLVSFKLEIAERVAVERKTEQEEERRNAEKVVALELEEASKIRFNANKRGPKNGASFFIG